MIEKKGQGERLLEVDNVHAPDCGPPPALDAADKYVGYFENTYGEQWVFIGDPGTGKAEVRGGDVGWVTPHEVSLQSPWPNVILNEAERMWIVTCFMAMSHASFDEVVANGNKVARARLAAVRKSLEDETR